MNTRRYPRTLNEAFPHGAEYGCAIERPIDKPDYIVVWASLICLAVWLGVEYFK